MSTIRLYVEQGGQVLPLALFVATPSGVLPFAVEVADGAGFGAGFGYDYGFDYGGTPPVTPPTGSGPISTAAPTYATGTSAFAVDPARTTL